MGETTELKYDAFISYRHADLDIFAAEHLHRLLENFKVPKLADKEMRKNQIQKISRVFRDKDELPASDNLAEPIEEALRNSRFLIVICSPRTPESKWVSREIELFAKYRGRENILAVLIEGEPSESFPEVLCHGERVMLKEDGTTETEPYEIEPLAADIRGASKGELHKRLKHEVLRLAAPILHCTYDDLKQRHKEQRLKRIISIATTIAVVLLAFGCYATVQNIKIRRLQSEALAVQAAQAYAEGDRKQGIELAGTALSARYTPQAQAELTELLQVYDNGEAFQPSAVAKHDTKVLDMAVNEDCSLILSTDQLGQIYLWDGITGELLHQEESAIGYVASDTMLFIDEQRAVYCGNGGIALFDAAKQSSRVIADNIAVIKLALSHDRGYLLLTDGADVYLYDTASWTLIYSAPADENDTYAIMGALNVTDGGKLISYGMMDIDVKSMYVVIDTQKKQALYQESLPYDWVEFARMEEDGSSYVLSKSFSSVGSFMVVSKEQLLHYSASGEELWSYQENMLMRQPIEKLRDTIVLASGSDLIMIDSQTGKEQTRLGFSSNIKKMILTEESIRCYLQDGTAFTVTGQGDRYDAVKLMESAVQSASKYAQSGEHIVIMPEEDIQIYLYRKQIAKGMQQYEPLASYISGVMLNDAPNRVLTYGFASNEMLLFSPESVAAETNAAAAGIHIQYGNNEVISGVYQTVDHKNFVIVTNGYVRVYSWENGSLVSESAFDEFIDYTAVSGDGHVLCFQTFDALHTMSLAPDSTWDIEEISLPEQLYYRFYLNYDGTCIIGRDAEMKGEVYNLQTGETSPLVWSAAYMAYNGVHKQYLVVNQENSCIELYSEQNELLSSMEKKISMIQNVGVSQDGRYLFVQNLNATLELYRASDLKLEYTLTGMDVPIGRVEPYGGNKWALYSSDTYGGTGYLCNSQFEIIGRVPKLYSVSQDGKTLYTANQNGMLSTEIYSIRELQAMMKNTAEP